MLSSSANRRSQLGQSFTTCLLMVIVFFGGIGTYYFKVFQWRHLEEPLKDLQLVKNNDPVGLTDFRKFTIPKIVDPALIQLTKLVDLRKSTNAASAVPEGFDQTCKEISNSLRQIMNTAKLRLIPKTYEKQYNKVLLGISEIYKSLRALENAVAEDLPDAKKRYLQESIDLTKSAKANLGVGRDFFPIR